MPMNSAPRRYVVQHAWVGAEHLQFIAGLQLFDFILRSNDRQRTQQPTAIQLDYTHRYHSLGSSSPDTPVRRVALYPIPQQSLLIRYHYITSNLAISSAGAAQTQLSADADEPIVPLRYRHAILFHALYHWYRDREDDPRSQVAKQEYTDLVLRIAGDTEIGGRRARLVPRLGSYTRRARRPYSGSPGRFDKNGAFDRLEDIR